MDSRTRIIEEIVPRVVHNGSFNNETRRAEIASCDMTPQEMGGDHFTSHTFFVNVSLVFEDNRTPEKHHILIKLSPEDPEFAKQMATDMLFYHETLLYTEVIPFMEEFLKKRGCSIQSLFPKCYYAKSGSGPGKDIIVLQDLSIQGFRTAEERTFLDFDHCVLALKNLGRLHAVSYGMKHLENSAFHSMVKRLKKQTFRNTTVTDADSFLKIITARAVKHFAKGKDVDQNMVKKLTHKFEKSGQLFMQLSSPKEPLAVMCHGDFCRNNIFFRYESGKPREVKFFDLQTVKYASPAIDLSFFFYLNTTAELRKRHWDNLFKEYHYSLTNNLAEILGCSVQDLMEDYSLEHFKKDFADHAIYGFLICSYFLPEMMVEPSEQIKYETCWNKTPEEMAGIYVKIGGEEATKRVGEIVEDLVARGAV